MMKWKKAPRQEELRLTAERSQWDSRLASCEANLFRWAAAILARAAADMLRLTGLNAPSSVVLTLVQGKGIGLTR